MFKLTIKSIGMDNIILGSAPVLAMGLTMMLPFAKENIHLTFIGVSVAVTAILHILSKYYREYKDIEWFFLGTSVTYGLFNIISTKIRRKRISPFSFGMYGLLMVPISILSKQMYKHSSAIKAMKLFVS